MHLIKKKIIHFCVKLALSLLISSLKVLFICHFDTIPVSVLWYNTFDMVHIPNSVINKKFMSTIVPVACQDFEIGYSKWNFYSKLCNNGISKVPTDLERWKFVSRYRKSYGTFFHIYIFFPPSRFLVGTLISVCSSGTIGSK